MTNAVAAIVLAGCTSTSLADVYLLSLSYTNSSNLSKVDPAQINANASSVFRNLTVADNGTFLEVRVGYMGLCISQTVGAWLCSGSATSLANLLKTQSSVLSGGEVGQGDPLNLIWIASKFKEDIIFSGLM